MYTQESAASRIEDLTNNLISQRSFENFDVRKLFRNIFGDSQISFIYPKNLFEENQEYQEFYIFHEKFISVVNRNEGNCQIETYPLNIKELRYQRSENLERETAKLELHMNHGLIFEFNSQEDNNESWKKTFTALIQDIYTNLIS